MDVKKVSEAHSLLNTLRKNREKLVGERDELNRQIKDCDAAIAQQERELGKLIGIAITSEGVISRKPEPDHECG